LSEGLAVPFEEAEAMKLDLGRGGGAAEATRLLGRRVDALVDEIRGSIDYYSSQEEGDPVTSVIVTGGGSLTAGFVPKLEQTLRLQIQRATPLTSLSFSKSGLTEEQAVQVDAVAAAAIGLAMGDS
jgi:Tfp pilus assembly PilM family ATPase